MSMNLESVTPGAAQEPPRVVVYGQHKVGKTTFAVGNPLLNLPGAAAPIVLRTENGLSTLRVPTFPSIATSYGDVIEAITELYAKDHPYLTFVLDSLDWLEPLVWRHTCAENGWPSIEAPGFGKGFTEADKFWRQILDGLDALRSKGMTIVCIAHSEVKQFNAPDSEPYERYQIKLQRRAAALIEEWADVIGFAHLETFTQATKSGFNKTTTRAVTSDNRVLSVSPRPAYTAGNRYGMVADVPLNWQAFINALAPAFATEPELPLPEYAVSAVVETDADVDAVAESAA